MNSTFISIIIPTFNCAGILKTALSSIKKQSFKDYEIWVIDGLSNDETIDVAQQHASGDSRCHFISEKDSGIYEAMNKGIHLSTGKWLFFMGSDDSFCDEFVLEEIYQAISKEKELKMIYGNVKYIKDLSRPSDYTIYDGPFDGDKLLEKNICHQSAFYHCSLFKKFGLFNTSYKTKADWDFNLRCFNHIQPYYVNRNISNFYAGGRSSQFTDADFHNDFLENMLFHYSFTSKHNYFGNKKVLVLQALKKKTRQLDFTNAWKAFRTLFFHLPVFMRFRHHHV